MAQPTQPSMLYTEQQSGTSPLQTQQQIIEQALLEQQQKQALIQAQLQIQLQQHATINNKRPYPNNNNNNSNNSTPSKSQKAVATQTLKDVILTGKSNTKVSITGWVVYFQPKEASKASGFAEFVVSDGTGSIRCVAWEDTNNSNIPSTLQLYSQVQIHSALVRDVCTLIFTHAIAS